MRFSRCWNVGDQCGALPSGCVAAPSCSCPDLGHVGSLWPEGCECATDGTFNCYYIGI
jgi:hypothetical protein